MVAATVISWVGGGSPSGRSHTQGRQLPTGGHTGHMQSADGSEFPAYFDPVLATGSGGPAHFGPNVLQGLVEGIRLHREEQRRTRWVWGTGVIACAMAMDDRELLAELRRCESTCVIVTKQEQRRYGKEAFQRLEEHAANAQGLAQSAFSELAELAPTSNGKPVVVGPYGPPLDGDVPAVRELGFRKVNDKLVPIVHAKMALVGDMCWTDEHPSGHVVDDIFFVPRKLWAGSANFTGSSRRNLEFGMWITDAALLKAARTFLLGLVAMSEPLRQGPDDMRPELAPVDYDDAAFIEYMREAAPCEDADE